MNIDELREMECSTPAGGGSGSGTGEREGGINRSIRENTKPVYIACGFKVEKNVF